MSPGPAPEPYPPSKPRRRRRGARHLLGLGLDGRDGHLRLTRGAQFTVVGGSAETHEALQAHCLKFREELRRRKKRLSGISLEEAREISDKIGIPPRG